MLRKLQLHDLAADLIHHLTVVFIVRLDITHASERDMEAFDNTDTFIYPIGDSVRARRIMEGTMEGRAILNVLEARGFLELAPLE